jgi:hypothetical protein
MIKIAMDGRRALRELVPAARWRRRKRRRSPGCFSRASRPA